jgi:hypothetical protein
MASGHYDVTKGIFTGGKPGLETISNNILMKCIVGLSPEDGSTSRNHIYQNISTLNNIGVGMYYESTSPVPQPRLENNDVWWNWSTDTIPPDLQANFVRATAATGAINVNKEYTNNLSQDPRFRNVEIFDLVHDVDNDALFSDTEEKIETDPWFEDTDGDGLSDGVETNTRIYKGPNDTGSDPLNPDTNGNGINDGLEVQFGHDPSLIGDGFRIPGVGNSGLATLVITICLLGMYMSKKSSRMSRLSRTDL